MDFQELTHSAEQAQLDTDNNSDIVLFEEAVEHVTHIARAINQPQGNALVLGAESAGRKSMSKIAASLAGIPSFEI